MFIACGDWGTVDWVWPEVWVLNGVDGMNGPMKLVMFRALDHPVIGVNHFWPMPIFGDHCGKSNIRNHLN